MESSNEVTLDDQLRINQFSVLNQQLTHLELQLAEDLGVLEATEDGYEELKNNLDFFSEDSDINALSDNPEASSLIIPTKVGGFFVHLPYSQSVAHLHNKITTLKSKITHDQEKIAYLKERLKELKCFLYQKFQGAINLERE